MVVCTYGARKWEISKPERLVGFIRTAMERPMAGDMAGCQEVLPIKDRSEPWSGGRLQRPVRM